MALLGTKAKVTAAESLEECEGNTMATSLKLEENQLDP